MNGRRVAIGLGLVAALGAGAWWAIAMFAPQAFIDIDQARLQRQLDGYFPQKHCTMMVACVTLSRPVVKLTEGSPRIGMSADILVTLGHREMPGQVTFSGVLRYVRYQGDFFLDDVQVENFALTGVSPDMVQVVKQRGPDALRRALQGHPIYTLRGDSAREALAKLAVRNVQVVDGKVRVTFLSFGS
jgi:hypothetical protein